MKRAKAILSLIAMTVVASGTARAQNAMEVPEAMLGQEMLTDSIPQDSLVAPAHRNFFQKILDYFKQSNREVEPGKFDVTFIGGPHYSEEKKFGIGLLAAGVYRPDFSTPPSDVSLYGDVSTVGFFELGISGHHISRNDASRINYKAYFYSFPNYFWGVGFPADFNDANKTKYKKLETRVVAEWVWRVADNMYLGPSVDFSYIGARNPENPLPWAGYDLSTYSYGVGATYSYDTRDNLTGPTRGMYGQAAIKAYPAFLFNKHSFGNLELTYSYYKGVWKGGILAMRVHGMFSLGHDVPWGLVPYVGGSYDMRGYFEGRYCDRNEADVTFELRQHVWRRNGIAVWAGVGEVFPNFRSLRWDWLLPSYGIGYRWEFKKNINIRFDLGFGRRSSNFIFSINEAF